ncbi:hypothetical protein SERLA73DRAFT_77298 [Serpula lacrymans var. lacrymans S7.3]|uniref:Uncharacterized protein n=1 Tax=Serpula lacrymans var. lacrymans (strain S7.3) TaxID=936435 RepID=F8Q9M8_SERL3|nr:hypothetical protein SERLA73DRAFT_77298 [Serpula lacrymans var. lacrymans S7.3]
MAYDVIIHAVSTKVLYPRLVSQLSKPSGTLAGGTVAKSAAGTTAKEILSLGASGAIYAAVTLSALAFPDASISLIFLPFFAIPIQSGVGAIIALDAIGILRGWKILCAFERRDFWSVVLFVWTTMVGFYEDYPRSYGGRKEKSEA